MSKTTAEIAREANVFSAQILDIMPTDDRAAVGGAIIAADTIGFAAGRSPEELRTLLTVVIGKIASKVLAAESGEFENQDGG